MFTHLKREINMNRRKVLCAKKKIWDNKTILIGICWMLILLLKAFQQAPFDQCEWNTVILTFSYRYGFIQRGFLGTIIDFLSELIPISPHRVMLLFQYTTMLIYYVAIAMILLWSIYEWNNKKKVFHIIAISYVMGSGYTTWFSKKLFGHSDVWLIILTIIALFAIWKNVYEVSIFISIIGMLIHQAYFFMYLNVILLALAFKYVINEAKRKRVAVNFLLVVLSCIALFIYFQFFSHVKSGINYEYVRNRSLEIFGALYFDVWELEIKNYLFGEKSPLAFTYGIQNVGKYAIFEFVLLFPIFIELGFYWKTIVWHTKDKVRKFFYQVVPFGIITTLPLFVMHSDYGRWMHAVYFYEIVAVWLVNLVDDMAVTNANSEMIKRVKKNIGYYIALAMLWTCMDSLQRNYIRVEYINIVQMVEELGTYLKILISKI